MVSALVDAVWHVIPLNTSAAAALGALFAAMFGMLRLAGVDFGKWYRDPGEVSEGNDRSWIGIAKWTTFTNSRCLLVGILLFALGGRVLDLIDPYTYRNGVEFDLLAPLRWWHWTFWLGLIPGIILAQALAEAAWRLGLMTKGHPVEIMLARTPSQEQVKFAGAPGGSGSRRLIICCDGTWNSPSMKRETNIVLLLRAINPVVVGSNPDVPQIAYYHIGVGTGDFVDRFLGGGAGIGLSSSVKACYGFLVDNYREDDDILLFGFSRGAYVARSLAGLIGLVGLLPKCDMYRFDEVWNYYTQPVKKRDADARILDQISPNRYEVPITCIGVWDTVGALGIPGTRVCSSTYAFHETSLGAHVQYAFQALAMDERRGNFQPAIWVKTAAKQVLEQVWFPGVHSNIGGGYFRHGLSDTTLLWMLSELQKYNLLDINLECITSAIGRDHAEDFARGKLEDSRSLLWKLISCPMPRPVGITDESEKIHESAFARAAAPPIRADAYRKTSRRAWLMSIPILRRASRSLFEIANEFPGPPPGVPYVKLIPDKRGLCAWLMKTLFGNT